MATPTRTLNDAVAATRQQFPPGDEELYAWENADSFVAHDLREKGRLLLAMQQASDTLRTEQPPQNAVEKLSDWEAAQGLASTKITLTGTTAQRQGQVVARWREHGASTLPDIQAALTAICGYTPAIIEHSRATLTQKHTYWVGGAEPPAFETIAANATTTFTIPVGENAPCGLMGAQLLFSWTFPTPGDLRVTLTGPDATSKQWPMNALGVNALNQTAYYLFAPEFAGKQADGTWTVSIVNSGGNAGQVQPALPNNGLFCEAIGRQTPGSSVEGLGARIFEWCALIDETLVGAAYDRATARAIVQRWDPAHTMAFLAVKATNGSTYGVWSDANSTFDGCLWGT